MTILAAQDAAGSFDWAEEFRPFTPIHWIASGACLTSIVASSWLGARWRSTERERRLRLTWAWIVAAVQVWSCVYYLLPPIDWARALPFHICDIAGWIAFFALLTGRRWLRTMLYYWGIGLSTQAFFTPILHGAFSGYAHMFFWIFWGQHLTIVGSAVYDLVVLRYRPTWHDCRVAIGISSAWVATMFVYNRIAGTNYVFVGPTRPQNPTLIDKLGDYPVRVLWLSLIVATGFALATAVWPSARRRASPARTESAAP